MSSPAGPLPSASHQTPASEPATSATSQTAFAPTDSYQRVGPLRVSSPRLFRSLLSSMPDATPRLQAELPPSSTATRARDGPFSLADAIGRASQAVAHAGEAFQSRAGGSGEEVVDLTDSPPEHPAGSMRGGPHSDYLSFTTHPSDSRRPDRTSRPLSTLHEPIFGYMPIFAPGPPPEFDDDTIIGARDQRYSRPSPPRFARTSQPRTTLPRLYHTATRRVATEQEERDAVRRQRENHAAWQRTQARARELQRRQEEEADSNFESHQNTPEESPRPSSSQINMSTEQVESVDLTEVDDNMPIADVIARQRAEQVASQMPNISSDSGRTPLTAFKCPICMDDLTDATVTVCGHLFCHRCLLESLKASATQRQHETGSARKNGLCPVCRKSLAIRDTPGNQRTLIPLALKVLKASKRKRDEKGKGRAQSEEDEKSILKRAKRETSEELFHALLEAMD